MPFLFSLLLLFLSGISFSQETRVFTYSKSNSCSQDPGYGCVESACGTSRLENSVSGRCIVFNTPGFATSGSRPSSTSPRDTVCFLPYSGTSANQIWVSHISLSNSASCENCPNGYCWSTPSLNSPVTVDFSCSGYYSLDCRTCSSFGHSNTLDLYSSGQCTRPAGWSCHSAGKSVGNTTCTYTVTVTGIDCSKSPDKENLLLCPPSVESCSQPIPISDPNCEGGQGLWASNGNAFGNMFGTPTAVIPTGNYFFYFFNNKHNSTDPFAYRTVEDFSSNDSLYTRPDGSKCVLPEEQKTHNMGEAYYYGPASGVTYCPLGLAQSSSSSSDAQSSSSSSPESSSSVDGNSSSSGDVASSSSFDSNSSGSGNDSSSGSGSGYCFDNPLDPLCDENIGCENLANCNWARHDVQIKELGVAIDIRTALNNLITQNERLSDNQVKELRSLRDSVVAAIGTSSNNVVDALDRLIASQGDRDKGIVDSIVDGISGMLDGISKGIDGIADALFGSGGSPSPVLCDYTTQDCGVNIAGAGDTTWGVSKSEFDAALGSFGLDSASYDRDSKSILADTAKVFASMRDGLSPFTNYINSQLGAGGTVIDMSFEAGPFSCGQKCKIDLRNVGGVDAGKMINDFFVFVLGLGILFRLIHVARTIGQTG